jgi:Protein of unknown function (DUF2917)
MNPAITANQSDWSAFLNPDAAPVGPRRVAYPRIQNGPITRANTGGRFSLLGNGHVSIAATPGLVIHVRRGTLWITQPHDADDHVVHAGERFVADRAGRLVISAFARGEVELEWPSHRRERAEAAYPPVAAAA